MDFTITGWKRYMLVQPPLMVLLFAYALSGTIFTNLLEYRTCTITFGINKTECLMLYENSSSNEASRINKLVQPEVSLIMMSKSFIESVLPAFMSLFVGPWSDKYGRKPLLLMGHLGTCLMYILISIMSTIEIDPWYLLLAFIPTACCGGFCIILLASICYICDISNEVERVWQLAYLQILISLGILMGTFAGPFIFNRWGYTYVFCMASLSCIYSGFFVLFCIPETIHATGPKTWKSLCNVKLIKDMVNSCIKKRDNFDRTIVWCCILCINLLVLPLEGDITIGYLFASARLGWDVESYAYYSASNLILGIFGTFIGIKILGYCTGLPDTITAIIALMSSTAGVLMRSFTYHPWHMYLATVLSMFGGITSPTIRAILSKSMPVEDAGKVFSLTMSIETLTPLGASSLYGLIYSAYMPPVYPSPVWLVSVGIFLMIILIVIYIHMRISRRERTGFTTLIHDNE